MNTVFFLLAEYSTGDIPLSKVAQKYFGHEEKQMQSWARLNKYPFPIYRGGSQRSQWLVNITDLASYIDKQREEAAKQYQALA